MPKKEQFSFQEIGKRVMNGATEKGAEVAYHVALDRLAVQLIEDDACHIVDLHLENLEQAENKNAAATYRYRVDCDGEWGEIYFDFENKRIKTQRLAEWDTTKSHKYAWKVIGVIALKQCHQIFHNIECQLDGPLFSVMGSFLNKLLLYKFTQLCPQDV